MNTHLAVEPHQQRTTSWATPRRLGLFAWVMAWVGLVGGQLHALSRFATADGKADLELPLTRLWAERAADAVRPLLDWADPDVVYLTYGKIWLPVVLAFTLCALLVHRHRRPTGFEKWAWRVALAGYVLAVVGVFLDYWTQWTRITGMLDVAFAVTAPALLLTVLGSTMLGVSLLRRRFRPRTSAWLLALSLPLTVLIVQVTSLGSVLLPVAFAFGILGRNMARDPSSVDRLADRRPQTR